MLTHQCAFWFSFPVRQASTALRLGDLGNLALLPNPISINGHSPAVTPCSWFLLMICSLLSPTMVLLVLWLGQHESRRVN